MLEKVAGGLLRVVETAAESMKTFDETTVGLKPAPKKWSAKEILGHLIDSAANNHQRFVRAQQTEELVFPKYEQDPWVALQGYQNRPWSELVELWLLYNRHLAHVIQRVPKDKLEMPCRIGSAEAVTLGFLIDDYLAHLQHHLPQIEHQGRL